MGRAPRVLSGWVPTLEDPSEWTQNQREMMFALAEVERDICDGCGGFLSFTTMRDHLVNVGRVECQHCAAIHRQSALWEKEAETAKGTAGEWFPSAQKIRTRPLPLEPEHYEASKTQGLLGPREED